MKPLKHYNINESYVFTQHGCWLITPEFKFTYKYEEYKYFSDFQIILKITKCNS